MIEYQPADIVLTKPRGFNLLRFLVHMNWTHLLIIDELLEGDYGILESISKGVACGLLSFYNNYYIAVYRYKGITPEQQQCIRHMARKRGRYRYDFWIPFRILKKVGFLGVFKLIWWLWTKSEPPPLPHFQDSYIVCSELAQESYQACDLRIIDPQYTLIPDAIEWSPLFELVDKRKPIKGEHDETRKDS